ncbi:MAG TPA: glycosyltransferase [Gaiellaceae bacterium]|nr:glycosyltransferase [Gaiellaceae bacterium]
MAAAAPLAADGRTRLHDAARPRIGVVAAVHPLTGGAAQFNTALVSALRELAEVDVVSWRRLYPPLLYRGQERDERSRPPRREPAAFLLDWHRPRSWSEGLRRLAGFGAEAVVLPWLHPVSAPPSRWLLRHAAGMRRVVVCHNVVPHERVPGGALLTRATLRHADLLVTHAPHQRDELAALGLGDTPVLEAFHPRFVADDLAPAPAPAAVAEERRRLGDPGLLLVFFGAVRPYKGLDLALEALAQLDPALGARLVVAGRFWEERNRYDRLAERLGIADRLDIRDGYVTNEDAALLLSSADGVVLPYRSATQSGVAQLAFAYGAPVVATRVGGLPAAVAHGRTGLLCPAGNAFALARALERLAAERDRLAAGVRAEADAWSFRRYAELLLDAAGRLP